jgi:hypothetical protein
MDQQTAPLTSWPENFHNESLPTSGVEDEFSNFLEFGFTFPELENGAVQNPVSLAPPTSSMEDVDMIRMSQGQGVQGQTAQAHTSQNHQPAQTMGDLSSMRHQEVKQHFQDPNIEPQFYTQTRQQQQSHQQQSQQPQQQTNPAYAHRYQGIPPTPNSIEFHGGASRYPTRIENEARGYEHYARTNDDQVRIRR